MKVLVTGASGFLGSEMVNVLSKRHEVVSLGRKKGNSISCDLGNEVPNLPLVDIVLHAAGKAHSIPKNDLEAKEFFNVNTKGTKNLLEALNENLPKTLVFISTVAVYGKDEGIDIDESFPLNGNTPYAQSKIKAEKICIDWGKRNGVTIVILRLPLISGRNPPGNLDFMASAIKKGFYFRIGKAEARKSMVSAVDVSLLIPILVEKSGIFNLTDGLHPQVKEIENRIGALLNKKITSLPFWPLKIAAKMGDVLPMLPINSLRLHKLSASLTFSDLLARQELNWKPTSALKALEF